MAADRPRRPWRVVALTDVERFLLASATAALVALVVWLDSPASPFALRPSTPLRTVEVFSIIVTGIEILAGWVAAAAEVTAAYVWVALQWLGSVTSTFLKSTGAMFAKVWDAAKIVWTDALRPALVWIDDHLKRLYAWLQDTFRPVFDFLREVRCRLMDFYSTFVRPVVDTIEWIRQINRVLLAFHIDVLQSLDKYLQQLEQRIEEPFLWINEQINKIWNALELVVTFDGFFQRLTLIGSMVRYAPDWMKASTNLRSAPVSDDGAEAAMRAAAVQTQPDLLDEIAAYADGADNDVGAVIEAALATLPEYVDSFPS